MRTFEQDLEHRQEWFKQNHPLLPPPLVRDYIVREIKYSLRNMCETDNRMDHQYINNMLDWLEVPHGDLSIKERLAFLQLEVDL